jgi:hypothetical protein
MAARLSVANTVELPRRLAVADTVEVLCLDGNRRRRGGDIWVVELILPG